MRNLVHNERLKYGATFANNIGLAMLIAGGLNATMNKPVREFDFATWEYFLIGLVGCIICVGFAQVVLLGNLKE
jgi:hypothetical protein